MMVTGKKIRCTAKVFIPGRMVVNMRANIFKIKNRFKKLSFS